MVVVVVVVVLSLARDDVAVAPVGGSAQALLKSSVPLAAGYVLLLEWVDLRGVRHAARPPARVPRKGSGCDPRMVHP